VPTASLVVGIAGLAAGEYVSVSSQADTEIADLARETNELKTMPEEELDELTGIYEQRGLVEISSPVSIRRGMFL
jgi:VIT1/CCC1 family predicted Fe2+/Mn2+ transporter